MTAGFAAVVGCVLGFSVTGFEVVSTVFFAAAGAVVLAKVCFSGAVVSVLFAVELAEVAFSVSAAVVTAVVCFDFLPEEVVFAAVVSSYKISAFADTKAEVGTSEFVGLPANATIEMGSTVMTASGELAFMKSDGTWNWV